MRLSDFGRYHFDPPIELLCERPAPQTHGEVVAHALIAHNNPHPDVAKPDFDSTQEEFDQSIKKSPELTLDIMQTALSGLHTVKLRR